MDEIICPICGHRGRHYYLKRGMRWRCQQLQCSKYFSVFSGTIFQDKKLSYKKFLLFLGVFVILANGVSFSSLSGLLDIQIKTAQVLLGKIREILIKNSNHNKLNGLIHMDGGYFGGKPRHGRVRRVDVADIKNHVESMLTKKTTRPISTLKANTARRLKNRRVVMVLREVSPVRGVGGVRTIVALADSETENYAMSLALKYIEPGSTVMTDESPAYNQLSKYFDHKTVEHAKEFATLEGVNSNHAESFFSRLRRHEYGVAHRLEPKYMLDIATEMAWREDVRRKTYRERISDLLKAIFSTGRSSYWAGYWQGFNRPGEITWVPEYQTSKIRMIKE